MGDWRDDLSDSAFEFQRAVWPVIARTCGGGELVPVETVTDTGFAKQLDMHAGIDAWHIKRESGMRGIASRVQWGDTAWNTFTIRKARMSGAETEYEKRLRAIRERKGWLMPYLTVQGYLTKPRRQGELLSVAVARTEDVVAMIADHDEYEVNSTWNASFYVVSWECMKARGLSIWTWNRSAADAA